jgi:SnoaL-like domain
VSVFHPDVEFRMPEVLPHGGVIHGREALTGYFGEVLSRWDDFRAVLDDLVDEYTDTALLIDALRS